MYYLGRMEVGRSLRSLFPFACSKNASRFSRFAALHELSLRFAYAKLREFGARQHTN